MFCAQLVHVVYAIGKIIFLLSLFHVISINCMPLRAGVVYPLLIFGAPPANTITIYFTGGCTTGY
jgi:hypothetical protein